ncbi:PD-(D/E)XK nuclease family protein [Microbulbifer agarilyticus]|uniref:PD-(D/E)XK nuclease family protein n=1 Tax=Microbulbifer agarilyticus TaxID=260552 RepID=UPI001C979076|nr:PD-(D/E)XK nuclease family protein [Microbulbifer agarilyticus]MBY6189458.1 PD-(D/E)XK nuclease family protein [Microbulbifer agarilyticus]
MLQPAFPFRQILDELPVGGLLLTPTNRLRNRCLQVFGAFQPASTKNWAPPAVESLQGWLDKLWFELQQKQWPPAMQRVLNREQCQLLWQACIDSTLDKGLINTQQLAGHCDGALAQLFQWCRIEQLENAEDVLKPHWENTGLQSGDYPLFELLPAFQQKLAQHNAITQDQRDLLILQAFEEGQLARLPQLSLAGFVQSSPLNDKLFAAAAEKIMPFGIPEAAANSLKVSRCHNLEEELQQAARWAATKLAQNPDASIGIVVNNLGQCRAQVEQIFARVLEPQWFSPTQPAYTLPFNFSAGTPLAKTPVGSASLDLLEALVDSFDYSTLRNLLFSPFWGEAGAPEQHLRSALMRRLQKLELREIPGNVLRSWAEKLAEELAPESPLPGQLNQLGDWARRWQRAPAEVWAQRFSELLLKLGWPGARNPNSQEYQQLVLWEQALESFANLSEFTGALPLRKALQLLRQIASRSPFQAETRDGPLQILGVLEAGGLAFEHIRLVGFGQQQWPAPPSPNPMLPILWQKEWKMPRASAERELELAQQLTQDLLNSSSDVVVSYACEEDGVGQSLSALFGSPAPADWLDSDPLQAFYETLEKATALEKISDEALPPLSADECAQVRGGAGVLKAQALCPLNAQLRYRLGADSFMQPGLGLSPAERGNLIHEMLAAFFENCKTSRQLVEMTPEQRKLQINTSIDTAIGRLKRKHPELPQAFWSLEKSRLGDIFEQWLPLELARPQFEAAQIESQTTVNLEGLTLTLRLDRLDNLTSADQEEQLVIDYKTGQTSVSDWLQARVREPQLPLYALFLPNVKGIAYGAVKNGDCKYLGTGELTHSIKGVKAVGDSQKNPEVEFGNWDQLTQHWAQALATLASEYKTGYAALRFDRPADNENQKNLWPLNRWPERQS